MTLADPQISTVIRPIDRTSGIYVLPGCGSRWRVG